MTTLAWSAEPLAQHHDVALMDLDGVTYAGTDPIPFASEGIAAARELGLRMLFLTNNASRPARTVAEQLTSLDIPAAPEDVYSSAMAGVELALARHGEGARVLAIGGAGLFEAIAASSLVRVDSADDNPTAVIQGMDKSLGWKDLSEAALAIGRGADFIATNLDSSLPTERGIAIGNGSMVLAVANATGATPVSAGKPEPEIFRLAAARAGAASPISVGDRLNTDVRGANASGIPVLHVLTGISSAREVILAVPEERPTYLGRDLRDLATPHPEVRLENGWYVCRSARARVDGRAVLVERGGTTTRDLTGLSLDEYRAVAVAVWDSEGADVGDVEVLGA